MIPKIIHYIWLGGKPKPAIVNICILSWREKNPDYTIIEWNESNLDIEKLAKENKFFAECRKRQMWAHMTDYIRLNLLYEIGGIYLDTDMLVLKSLDELLGDTAFMGKENCRNEISCGIMGFIKGNEFLKAVVEFYHGEIWRKNIWTIPQILTYVFEKSTAKPSLRIYDRDYFYPYPYDTVFDPNFITERSYTIHWWTESWNRKITPYIFLTTKHIRNPVMRYFAMSKKAVGFHMRKWNLYKKLRGTATRGC